MKSHPPSRTTRWPAWPALGVAALVVTPLLCLLYMAGQDAPTEWAHVRDVVLPQATRNTAWVLMGSLMVAGLLGLGLAWLTAVCEFPGRQHWRWVLVLPLALPAYVLAFVQIGLLDYAGPVQSWGRWVWGQGFAIPPIRSIGGLCLVFGLALYPYVYLLAYNGFSSMGARGLEAAQSLGLSRWGAFFRVALPQSAPWLAAGLGLVAMEVLADIGTVSVFNIDTLSVATYKAWFQLFSLETGARVSLALALWTLLISAAAHAFQARARYGVRPSAGARIPLRGAAAAGAWLACAFVFTIGLLIPLLQLVWWSAKAGAWQRGLELWPYLRHSVQLGLITGLSVALVALVMAWLRRHHHHASTPWLVRSSLLGYALPGSVLAVGLFIPLAWIDQQLQPLLAHFEFSSSWALRGSVLALVVGLSVRFLAVGFQPIDAQLQRITPSQEEAAQSLGLSRRALLWHFYPGALRRGLLTAVLLVGIDVIKEMPVTLMLRPFGWDTLAIRVFEFTSEGMWEAAAAPALCIVLCSLIPVGLLVSRLQGTPQPDTGRKTATALQETTSLRAQDRSPPHVAT